MILSHTDPLYKIIQKCIAIEIKVLWDTIYPIDMSFYDKSNKLYEIVIKQFDIKYELNMNGSPVMLIDDHMVSKILLTYMSRIEE